MENFSELIKNRRSMRKFTDEELTQDQVVALMKAALMSPSSKRSNSWQFVVVDDKEVLKELSHCKEQASSFIADAALAIVVMADPLASDVWIEDASIASLSWKELFSDPQLQQLIETGIANNTDLNIARLKVKEVEALLLSSKLAYLPSVSLTPQGTLSSVDGSKTSKTYDLAASADWELDIFGKLTNAKRGVKAALEQSEA